MSNFERAVVGVELYDGVTQVAGVMEGNPEALAHELIEHFSDTQALEEATHHVIHRIRDGEVYYSPAMVDVNMRKNSIMYESIGKYMQFIYTVWDTLPDVLGDIELELPMHWYLYTRNGRWMYMNSEMRVPEMLESHVVHDGAQLD